MPKFRIKATQKEEAEPLDAWLGLDPTGDEIRLYICGILVLSLDEVGISRKRLGERASAALAIEVNSQNQIRTD